MTTQLTVSDVYTLFNRLISSDDSISMEIKSVVFNEGYLYLLEKMITEAGGIPELINNGYFIVESDLVNYTSEGPYDYSGGGAYYSSDTRFYKSIAVYAHSSGETRTDPPTAQYTLLDNSKNILYDDLQSMLTNINYIGLPDSGGSMTNDIEYFSWLGDKIVFDRALSLGSSTMFHVKFYAMPTEIYFTDSATIATGTLLTNLVDALSNVDGYTIVGSTSGAIATIKSAEDTALNNLQVYSYLTSGTFENGETVTSPDVAGSSTITAPFESLTEVLQIPNKYKMMLATAIAATYFNTKRMPDEAAALDLSLNEMVKTFGKIKNNRVVTTVRSARRRS